MFLLAGCQSYERAPLDLGSHRAIVDLRLQQTEQLSAFAERLAERRAGTPEPFDPTDGLSPEEGEVLALFYNPDLRLARLNAGVALADFENAGLWEDPVFGFDGAEILSPADPFEYGFTLSLTIPISGRLGVEKDRASAAYETELRKIVDAEWTTRAEVRRAWGTWTAASQRVELLRDAIWQIERISSITDRLESVGELSRVEGRLFRIELADERAEFVQAELQMVRSKMDLLGLMGLSPDAPIALETAFPGAEPPTVDDDISRLIEANTALAVRRAAYQVAEDSLRLEVRKQYPDITIGAGPGSEGEDDRLLLGFSIPIPSLNANRAGIAKARAMREVARVATEIEFERLIRELAGAKSTLTTARTRRELFESEIVPMVSEQGDEIERIAALGEVDTFLLLETVTRLFDTKSRLLELRLAELDASITIALLLGPDEPATPEPIEVTTPHNTNTEAINLMPADGETQ